MKKIILGLLSMGLLTSNLFSKEVDINVIEEDDISKVSKSITYSGLDDFSNKKFSSISYESDSKGNQYFLIEFEDDGYILLNNDTNKNPIYSFDSKNIYYGIDETKIKKATVELDWLDIIAEEIPLDNIRKPQYRTSRSSSSRELITKIVWKSGSQRTDFDLFIKNANGDICNWSKRDKSNWGAKHLRDDLGGAYKTSYEAFQVDLDKMDRYATDNNLFSKDKGNYKFYIARYSGPNINYTFSYGTPNSSCSSSSSSNCPNGKWVQSVSKTGISNAYFGVRYTPKKIATSSFKNVKVSNGNIGSNFNFEVESDNYNIDSVYIEFIDANIRKRMGQNGNRLQWLYTKQIFKSGSRKIKFIAYNSYGNIISESKEYTYKVSASSISLGKVLLKSNYSKITQNYLDYYKNGPTSSSTYGGYHPGIDYRASVGTSVYSPIAGKVTSIDKTKWGRVSVKINGTNNYFIFLHLDNIKVKVGSTITYNTLIGKTALVGTTQPHLHIEVRNGKSGASWYFKKKSDTGSNINPVDSL